MQRCKEEDNFTNRRQAMLEGKLQSLQPAFYSNPKFLQIIENNYFFFFIQCYFILCKER